MTSWTASAKGGETVGQGSGTALCGDIAYGRSVLLVVISFEVGRDTSIAQDSSRVSPNTTLWLPPVGSVAAQDVSNSIRGIA